MPGSWIPPSPLRNRVLCRTGARARRGECCLETTLLGARVAETRHSGRLGGWQGAVVRRYAWTREWRAPEKTAESVPRRGKRLLVSRLARSAKEASFPDPCLAVVPQRPMPSSDLRAPVKEGPPRASGRPQQVVVSRAVLGALLGALLLSLFALAYLLGRESGRAKEPLAQASFAPPPGVSAPPATTASSTAAVPDLPAVEEPPPAAPEPPATSSGGVTPAAEPTGASLAPDAAPVPPALRASVAAYFQEVDAIQSQGKSWTDPEALARTLVEEGAKGDTSGFDGLITANRRVRDSLASIQVPEPCRAHHDRTLTLLDRSIALLENLKRGIQAGDMSALATMPAQARELESGAKEVDGMASEIKRRYGV